MHRRLWEVDALRGVALIAMVLYHLSYDIAMFGHFDPDFFRSGIGLWTGRTIGSTFIFLAGVSLTLSYRRASAAGEAGWRKYALRGLRIFGYGMLITLVTLLVIPDEPIIFGILHLIGASILLSYPFLRFKLLNVALALVFVTAGVAVYGTPGDSVWLAPLGLPPFSMVDYWPLFPWFGIALLGIAAGNAFYGERHPEAAKPAPPLAGGLAFLGRHSLFIYLVHQPLLIAALILLGAGSLEAF
jgi:uncharacterized membrane protein